MYTQARAYSAQFIQVNRDEHTLCPFPLTNNFFQLKININNLNELIYSYMLFIDVVRVHCTRGRTHTEREKKKKKKTNNNSRDSSYTRSTAITVNQNGVCLQWIFMLVHNECYFTMCTRMHEWLHCNLMSVIVVIWWTKLFNLLSLSLSLNGAISFIRFNVIFQMR